MHWLIHKYMGVSINVRLPQQLDGFLADPKIFHGWFGDSSMSKPPKMVVSGNRATPKSSILDWDFPYYNQPAIGDPPWLWNPPRNLHRSRQLGAQAEWQRAPQLDPPREVGARGVPSRWRSRPTPPRRSATLAPAAQWPTENGTYAPWFHVISQTFCWLYSNLPIFHGGFLIDGQKMSKGRQGLRLRSLCGIHPMLPIESINLWWFGIATDSLHPSKWWSGGWLTKCQHLSRNQTKNELCIIKWLKQILKGSWKLSKPNINHYMKVFVIPLKCWFILGKCRHQWK